jgi:hypothetical protein
VPGGPWEDISADLIGPLPESKGHNAILAIIDRFSKMIRLIPTTTEITALRLAELYRDNIWKMHGLPRRITSDRGPQFAAELMKSLCAMLGTKQNLSTAYHPQTDGHVERSHQETEAFLRHYIDHLQDDWYDWLAIGEFQYNDKIHSSTNHTPFFLNYGRHPWKGEIQTSKGTNPTAEDFVHALEIAREEAAAAMAQAAEKAKSHYDLRRRSARAYKPNDLIWLEATNLKEVRPSKKLSAKRYGPFKILAKVGESAYRIELPDNWRLLHPIFNESLLTPYTKPAFPSQRRPLPPPPDVVGEELEYEVEKVLDSRIRRTRRNPFIEFLIAWKGYGPEHNQWIKKKDLFARELLADFHKRYPQKPF